MPSQRRYFQALPDGLRRSALAKGEAGRRWVAGLDAIVAQVATAWDLQIHGAFERSSESLVLRVRRADGTRAVLKIGCPGVDLGREAYVCGLTSGRVLPKVLAHHAEFNALLLEALGRPIGDLGWPIDAQIRAICNTVEALWRTPTTGAGLVSGCKRAHWARDFIEDQWQRWQPSCDVKTRDRAFDYAAERAHAHRDDASVFVHGDAHARNTLTLLDGSQAIGAECRLIDPRGFFAERACELAVPMRLFNQALIADPIRLGRERCAWLAECTGVDERAIWQWGFIGCVAGGLRQMNRGLRRETPVLLRIANAWTRELPP